MASRPSHVTLSVEAKKPFKMTHGPSFSPIRGCKTETLYYPPADQKHLEDLFPTPMLMAAFSRKKRTIASSAKEYMINAGGNIKLPPVSS